MLVAFRVVNVGRFYASELHYKINFQYQRSYKGLGSRPQNPLWSLLADVEINIHIIFDILPATGYYFGV